MYKFKEIKNTIRIWRETGSYVDMYTGGYIDIYRGSILYKTPEYSIAGIFYCEYFEIVVISKNFDNFYFIEGINTLYEKEEMKKYFKRYVKDSYLYGRYIGYFNE